MKIKKYKKGSRGTYKVSFDDGRELSLYEEAILKYELLLRKEIDEATMIEVDRYNQECDVYYAALHSIETRFKSISYLRSWLQKREYPSDLIDKAIEKLIQQGYLNDEGYAKAYVNNQMITTSKGPYKLERELQEKKIDSVFIAEALEQFSEEEQIARIRKIIERGLKSNHTRGGVVLKQKIYNDLKLLGYDISLMNQIIDTYSFSNDSDIAKKEYEKLWRKYSRKYEGEEQQRKIQEKIYQKGLKNEED